MDTVRVVPYDPEWECRYAEEAESLRIALGPALARVHHIGSTSIPGIHAKPIVDILVEATTTGAIEDRTGQLEQLDYVPKGEYGIPGRRLFFKSDKEGVRLVNLHAYATGSPEIERHLAFRDYLRTHPNPAREYSELKTVLAARFPRDIQAYMDGKDPFIKQTVRAALEWR